MDRIITSVEIHSHTVLDLTNVLLKFFKQYGITINNCRGQTSDNASNIYGRYNGIHAYIKKYNPLAMWIPCTYCPFFKFGLVNMQWSHQQLFHHILHVYKDFIMYSVKLNYGMY